MQTQAAFEAQVEAFWIEVEAREAAYEAAMEADLIARFEAHQAEEKEAAKFRAYCKEMGANS